MNQFLSDARSAIIVWKLAIFRCILYSLVALGTSFTTASHVSDIPDLSTWDKFCFCVGLFVSWGTVMITFLDKTVARISSGIPPSGDTNFIPKV